VFLKEIISGFKKPLHNGVYGNPPGHPGDLRLTAQILISLLLAFKSPGQNQHFKFFYVLAWKISP